MTASNITLTSLNGSVGTFALPILTDAVAAQAATQSGTTGQLVGGIVSASAATNVAIAQAGDLRIGSITTQHNGDIYLSAAGSIESAAGVTSASALSVDQIAASASALQLTVQNAQGQSAIGQATIVSYDQSVNTAAASYAALLKNGAVGAVQTVDTGSATFYTTTANQAATQAAILAARAAKTNGNDTAQPTSVTDTPAQVQAYANLQNAANGTFTLSAAAIATYRPQAAAALGITDPTQVSDAQVQAYANALYQGYASTLSQAYGAGWQTAATSATRAPYMLNPNSTLEMQLTAGSYLSPSQLFSFVNETALLPAAPIVGNGVPNLVGGNIILVTQPSASGEYSGIGELAPPSAPISVADITAGNLTSAQIALLAVATAPGTVTINGTLNGVAVSYNEGSAQPGAVAQSITVQPTQPLFLSASGSIYANSQAAVYLQGTDQGNVAGGTLNIAGVVAAGDVNLAASASLLANATPAITSELGLLGYALQASTVVTSGDVTLQAGGGSIGASGSPFSYNTTGVLSYAAASQSVYLRADGPSTVLGQVFATDIISIASPNSSITSSLSGVALDASSIILTTGGNIGTGATPLAVQVAANGALVAQAAGSAYLSSPTEPGQSPVLLRIASVSAANTVSLSSDNGIELVKQVVDGQSYTGSVVSSAGSVTIRPGAGAFTMDPGTEVIAPNGSISIPNATLGVVLGSLQAEAINVNTLGTIESNGDPTGLVATGMMGVQLTANGNIGSNTPPLIVSTPMLQAMSKQGSIALTLPQQTEIRNITANAGTINLTGSGPVTVDQSQSGGSTNISALLGITIGNLQTTGIAGDPGSIILTSLIGPIQETRTGASIRSRNGSIGISGASVNLIGNSLSAAGSVTAVARGSLTIANLTAGASTALQAGGTLTLASAQTVTSFTANSTAGAVLGTVTSGGAQVISTLGDLSYTALQSTGGAITLGSLLGTVTGAPTGSLTAAGAIGINGHAVALGNVTTALDPMTIASATTLTVGNVVSGSSASLLSGGTLTVGSAQTVTSFTANSTAGAVLGTVTSGGAQVISTLGDLSYTALQSTGGAITLGSLLGTVTGAPTGSLTAAGAIGINGHAVALGNVTTALDPVTIASATSLSVGNLVSGSSAALLAGGSATIGNVIAGGTIRIDAKGNVATTAASTSGGDIDIASQAGGILAGAVTASGAVTLDAGGGAITLGSSASGGAQSIFAAVAVSFYSLQSRNAEIDVTALTGNVTGALDGAVTAGGSVGINGEAVALGQITTAANPVTIASATTLSVGAIVSGGSTALEAGGNSSIGSARTVTSFTSTASGTTMLGTITSGGAQTISSLGDLSFAALQSTGDAITASSLLGTVTGAAKGAVTAAGAIGISGNAVSLGQVTTAVDPLTIASGTTLSISNLVSGSSAAVTAGGDVTLGSAQAVTTLTVTSATGGATIGRVTSGGTMQITTRGDVDLSALTSTGGDVDVTSRMGAIMGGEVDAAGSADLSSYGDNTGDVVRARSGTVRLPSQTGTVDWKQILQPTAFDGGPATFSFPIDAYGRYLTRMRARQNEKVEASLKDTVLIVLKRVA